MVAPSRASWSEYEPCDPKLTALYAKGKALQWDAEDALDWSRPIDPSSPVHADVHPLLRLPLFERLSAAQLDHVTAEFTSRSLSQFMHAEQGALMVAARLVEAAPDYDAKLYAATQTMDEARHLEVFGKYVRRCGAVRPMLPVLRRLLDGFVNSDSWIRMLIGTQIILEGAALSSFHTYRKHSRDPLLNDLLDGVIRDEARHVGFGHLYLTKALQYLSDDEREEIADFAFDSIVTFSMTRQETTRAAAECLLAMDITLDDILRSAAASPAQANVTRVDPVRAGIADMIVPMLRRVGALTPRVEQKLKQAKFSAAVASPILDQLTADLYAQNG